MKPSMRYAFGQCGSQRLSRFAALLILSCFASPCLAQAQSWAAVYGSASSPIDARQTADGGYIMTTWSDLGASTSVVSGVVKLDASGNILWQTSYQETSGLACAGATDIVPTSDGGYLVLLPTCLSPGNTDFWLLKIDSTG